MNASVEDDDENPDPGVKGFAKRLFKDLFEIDVRSLALLRIALGLLILGDLANRYQNLEFFYTDNGIVTRAMSQEYLGDGFWSLYWIDGSVEVTQILFALTASVAIGLVFGFNTRLMTILCLVLVASIQIRNPLVLTGGHILLRMMLFWSMFLPLGAVWSIDSYLSLEREPERWKVASVATMGIMLQVALMYFFSGISKLNGFWFSGQAVEYVLSMEMYVKPAGEYLRRFPGLLQVISKFTVVLEIVAPILMFVPRINKFVRGMAMALFWWMHIVIWATMSIGIFSLTAMASWFVFVPSSAWNFYLRKPRSSALDDVWDLTPGRILVESVCAVALILVIALNIANMYPSASSNSLIRSIRTLANRTLLVQEFKLFGNPPLLSPMMEYPARTVGGEEVDLFGQMIKQPKQDSESTYGYFETQHWRRIHSNLMTIPGEPVPPIIEEMRKRLLEQLVNKWNSTHDPARHIVDATINCYVREIQLNNSWGEPQKEVWAHWSRRDPFKTDDAVSESLAGGNVDDQAKLFRKVAPDEPFRQWEDARGRSMEARYAGTTTGPKGQVLVLFEKRSGKMYDFPLKELSEADQKYLREE